MKNQYSYYRKKKKKMKTPMSNSELYYILVEKGYNIKITEENNSKVIRFNGKYSTKESNEKISDLSTLCPCCHEKLHEFHGKNKGHYPLISIEKLY